MDNMQFDRLATTLARVDSRRSILRRFGAALGAAGLAVVVRHAPGARAKDARKSLDFKSKEDFKHWCELSGGTFSEDGIGNTNCNWPNGFWEECDGNGQDCWTTPPPRRNTNGTMAPISGTGGVVNPAQVSNPTFTPSSDSSGNELATPQPKRRGKHRQSHHRAAKR